MQKATGYHPGRLMASRADGARLKSLNYLAQKIHHYVQQLAIGLLPIFDCKTTDSSAFWKC